MLVANVRGQIEFRACRCDNRLDTSEFENEWRTDKILGRLQDGWSDRFSNFSYTLARSFEIQWIFILFSAL
jgi:hypothetical protein